MQQHDYKHGNISSEILSGSIVVYDFYKALQEGKYTFTIHVDRPLWPIVNLFK